MRRLWLFVTAMVLGGFGGAAGSILGNAFGRTGLYAGGVIGGLVAALLVARTAVWRGWIERERFLPVALGTALGFVAAAGIAVSTLSSPVGPVLSTLLIGAGALLGAGRPSRADASPPGAR